ncbi:hypothetical protein E1301_Tti012972 [Triplophysa tibetana]|uniref:Uncharacterized protein n=1 Tax=Triplophysa tibetana TaxID=1572043 RepID=A0A5A9NVR1_9TELE|nr:hypothetical protein E1301_Tti012972 [Triplophysa tibetana]
MTLGVCQDEESVSELTKHKSVFAARDGEPVVKGQTQPRIERRLLAKSLKTLVISKGKPAPAWTRIVVKMALKVSYTFRNNYETIPYLCVPVHYCFPNRFRSQYSIHIVYCMEVILTSSNKCAIERWHHSTADAGALDTVTSSSLIFLTNLDIGSDPETQPQSEPNVDDSGLKIPADMRSQH